jgi:phosphatidylinositol 4-kinase
VSRGSAAAPITVLRPEILAQPRTAAFVVLNVSQLVQAIGDDRYQAIEKFIRVTARRSAVFVHRVLWNCQQEKCRCRFADDKLPMLLIVLEGKMIELFTRQEAVLHEHEFGLIDRFAEISERLLLEPIEKRTERLAVELGRASLGPGVYVPSTPQFEIVRINAEKSHARVPILVSFDVIDIDDAERKEFPFGCIFKVHDDVRMDAMMIQLIDKFESIFGDAGLETFMKAYKVCATGEDRGVIECIRNAQSRHDLGNERPEALVELFVRRYGPTWSAEFRKAQRNFVISVAPYSLLGYLFQVKDRHNANIMIDGDGHLMHIDFGFIFDMAPGGERDAPAFQAFTKLFRQCFIAARARYPELEAIA